MKMTFKGLEFRYEQKQTAQRSDPLSLQTHGIEFNRTNANNSHSIFIRLSRQLTQFTVR